MQRAKDFREFMSHLNSIEDSIDFLPELPANKDVGYLIQVLSEFPIADNPYERSDLRDGLKIWDSVYLPIPKAVTLGYKRLKDISALRSINAEWEKTKEALGMIGRPDGVHYLRPKGKYILDIMNDDVRMLQGAHILAHREPVATVDDEYTFGQTSKVFLKNLVKLFLARKYNLLMNMHPDCFGIDAFRLYGIEVCGSSDLRSPTLIEWGGINTKLIQDETVVTVLGSVGIEAHPRQASKGTEWREINKWSCLPTLVALAGWEGIDYITHAERVELLGEPCYAVPCGDLQPMGRFEEILEKAVAAKGSVTETDWVMTVEKWFESEDFRRGLAITPQLPCPECIKLNENAEGIVRRPRSRKPKISLKDARKSNIPEIKEWCDYVDFMNNCIKIGRTATAYALGSVTTVKNRNCAFKKREQKLKRLKSLINRHAKALSSGFLSKAEAMETEIEKLKKELET